MSIGACKDCWRNNAVPKWVAEANIDMAEGKQQLAEWFLEQTVWHNDSYITIKDYQYEPDPDFWKNEL